MLVFHFDGEKLRISTGISILPKYWNPKTQRGKQLVDFKEYYSLNQFLEKQSSVIIDEYNKLLNEYGYAEKNILKENYLNHIPNKKIKIMSFWNYFEDFIKFKRNKLGDVRDYNNSLRKHLIATEKIIKRKVTFDSIKKLDNGFVDEMENYLTFIAINSKGEEGLTQNTIGKQFKNLRAFLNWCFEREYVKRFSKKHLKVRQENVDEIYMTIEELEILIKMKLSDHFEKKVRDGFILGCNTALRFSVLLLLRTSHINLTKGKETIELQQKKTKKKVIIPINKTTLSILKKYNYESPIKGVNGVDFNKTIKKICKDANIDSTKTLYKTIKGKLQEIDYKKYELVSSITCRRTFCTLQVKKGTPISFIMAVSGHKTEKSFFRYIKLDAETKAEEMRKYMD